MPSFRRSQRTLISGLGVAGAVLAAIVVAFAVASGIVAYSLTSLDPLPRSSGALVLAPLRVGVIAPKPLVLRPAAYRPVSAPAGAETAAVVATVRVRTVTTELTPHTGRLPVTAADPQGGGDADRPAPSAQPAPDRLLKPVGDAIGATGHAVGATTESLAAITTTAGAHTDPVARTVAAVADATTPALRTTADRSVKVVGRLLGDVPR
jgi:hypothetical protein